MADLPWPVHLVADAPILHCVRLAVAMLHPHIRVECAGRRVAILDQRGSLVDRAGAEVDTKHGLDVHGPAVVDELVGAELVGLDRLPSQLAAVRALFAWSDAIAPIVAAEH